MRAPSRRSSYSARSCRCCWRARCSPQRRRRRSEHPLTPALSRREREQESPLPLGEGWVRAASALRLAALALFLCVPFVPGVPLFWVNLLDTIGIASIVALGLVVLTGVAGMTSFGQASFMGFGAYASALLTQAGFSPWLGLPAAIVASLAAALVIGAATLRLSGHYLAL